MTAELIKELGIAGTLAFVAVNQLFALVERFRKSSAARASNADAVIASQLERTTTHGREDYLRIENRVNVLESKIDGKLDSILIELGALRERDAVLSVEVNSWPAHLKRVDRIEHDLARTREGLNQVRDKAGMPPIDQTPPFGIQITNPSPHDVVTKKED